MSTSPSWFDQEKFTRLVKKVGTRSLPDIMAGQPGAESENRPHSGEGVASTARISLVSKPSSLLAEHRALPALPRRTAPLPSLKSVLANQTPPRPVEELKPQAVAPAGEVALAVDTGASEEEGELAEAWQKMGMLNEELAQTIHQRDQAVLEGDQLREQLSRAEEALKAGGAPSASAEEAARLLKERDEALAECQTLRGQLSHALEEGKVSESKAQDFTLLTEERDRARREYAAMRKDYETLKQEQSPKEETIKFRKEWEQQLETLQQKIEERDKEIAALKADAGAAGEGDEKLKREAASLREQLTRAKDEASIAQRGLALSQKALQQTRDTLREATEGSSLSRHNFDNLKNECSTLAQQVATLQTQNEQLARDLAAAKPR